MANYKYFQYSSHIFYFFPPSLKRIDGQASLPFGKRSSNDSSRKHPPGYPASIPQQITPRRQQWAKQCNSRFIVSRAGYELRKLAESRGGSADYCTASRRFHARGPHENLLYVQIGSVGATTPRWRNRRVKIDARKNGQELVPRERSIQLSVSWIAQTTSLRMIYERPRYERSTVS